VDPKALAAKIEYYRQAKQAVRLGLLTEQERDLIARRGTRKECYWGAHLVRLSLLLSERLAVLDAEHVARDEHLHALSCAVSQSLSREVKPYADQLVAAGVLAQHKPSRANRYYLPGPERE